MIYLVTNQQRIYDGDIQCNSIEESLELIRALEIIGLDTETKERPLY